MEKRVDLRVEIDGYGILSGEFVENDHGWFCREINGLEWDYAVFGAQAASKSPEDAALKTLNYHESFCE